MSIKWIPVLALGLAGALAARSSDWPQFLGPTRNGVYPGNDLAEKWPKEGPVVVWKKAVGQGFSGPAVAGGKLILFHRVNNREIVDCLKATNGAAVWQFEYPTAYRDDFGFDEGPRATPSISDGRVYTFGAEGMVHCLDIETGKQLWSADTKAKFGAPKGYFGMACSPLVEGGVLLLNIGGEDDAGIVAFDRVSGQLKWRASADKASYSSPVAATVDGKRRVFFFTRSGLASVDPADGRVCFDYPWRPAESASVSAATPLVIDDYIFISACYGAGAILLRVHGDEAEKVWSAEDVLSNHYATSVYYEGCLYGIDGRTDPGYQPGASLRCVDLKTGKLRWKDDSVGAATITLASGQLLILTEKGELIRARATPEKFEPNARAQVFPAHMRAFPALAGGYLFARGKETLFCVNLGKPL